MDINNLKLKDVKKLCKQAKGDSYLKKGNKKFKKKNGFYPFEAWNADISIAAFALPRLIYLRDHHCAIPEEFYCTPEKWKEVINRIVIALYLILEDDFQNLKENQPTIKEGLEFFGKYFRCLWD